MIEESQHQAPQDEPLNAETDPTTSSAGESRDSWREKVERMAREVAEREGCEIYDVELVGGGGSRALRVFIDKADGAGVSIDDCSNVSRGLNLLLDVEDVIPGERTISKFQVRALSVRCAHPFIFSARLGAGLS